MRRLLWLLLLALLAGQVVAQLTDAQQQLATQLADNPSAAFTTSKPADLVAVLKTMDAGKRDAMLATLLQSSPDSVKTFLMDGTVKFDDPMLRDVAYKYLNKVGMTGDVGNKFVQAVTTDKEGGLGYRVEGAGKLPTILQVGDSYVVQAADGGQFTLKPMAPKHELVSSVVNGQSVLRIVNLNPADKTSNLNSFQIPPAGTVTPYAGYSNTMELTFPNQQNRLLVDVETVKSVDVIVGKTNGAQFTTYKLEGQAGQTFLIPTAVGGTSFDVHVTALLGTVDISTGKDTLPYSVGFRPSGGNSFYNIQIGSEGILTSRSTDQGTLMQGNIGVSGSSRIGPLSAYMERPPTRSMNIWIGDGLGGYEPGPKIAINTNPNSKDPPIAVTGQVKMALTLPNQQALSYAGGYDGVEVGVSFDAQSRTDGKNGLRMSLLSGGDLGSLAEANANDKWKEAIADMGRLGITAATSKDATSGLKQEEQATKDQLKSVQSAIKDAVKAAGKAGVEADVSDQQAQAQQLADKLASIGSLKARVRELPTVTGTDENGQRVYASGSLQNMATGEAFSAFIQDPTAKTVDVLSMQVTNGARNYGSFYPSLVSVGMRDSAGFVVDYGSPDYKQSFAFQGDKLMYTDPDNRYELGMFKARGEINNNGVDFSFDRKKLVNMLTEGLIPGVERRTVMERAIAGSLAEQGNVPLLRAEMQPGSKDVVFTLHTDVQAMAKGLPGISGAEKSLWGTLFSQGGSGGAIIGMLPSAMIPNDPVTRDTMQASLSDAWSKVASEAAKGPAGQLPTQVQVAIRQNPDVANQQFDDAIQKIPSLVQAEAAKTYAQQWKETYDGDKLAKDLADLQSQRDTAMGLTLIDKAKRLIGSFTPTADQQAKAAPFDAQITAVQQRIDSFPAAKQQAVTTVLTDTTNPAVQELKDAFLKKSLPVGTVTLGYRDGTTSNPVPLSNSLPPQVGEAMYSGFVAEMPVKRVGIPQYDWLTTMQDPATAVNAEMAGQLPKRFNELMKYLSSGAPAQAVPAPVTPQPAQPAPAAATQPTPAAQQPATTVATAQPALPSKDTVVDWMANQGSSYYTDDIQGIKTATAKVVKSVPGTAYVVTTTDGTILYLDNQGKMLKYTIASV